MSSRLYSTIDNKILKLLNIHSTREYYYLMDNDKKIVREETFENSSNENHVQLVDDEDEWDNRSQSLFLNCKISIENVEKLFGEICCSDAILGIGLEWKPEKSRIKYCVKFGEFSINNSQCEFIKKDIEIKNVTSNIIFNWIIYIVNPGNQNCKNSFGKNTGLILGDGLLWSIIVDGSGSIFPIYEESLPDGPLWKYECDFIDITEDEFSEENIKIILNKSHKGYQYIQPKSANYNELMFAELISNAIATVILAIRKKNAENGNGELIDFSKNGSKGSILTVLKYFNDTLKFKINGTMIELQDSVKSYFDREY